jgi:integrase
VFESRVAHCKKYRRIQGISYLPAFGSAMFSRSAKRYVPFCGNFTMEDRTMPRLSHALPKYRKHRGSGQAVVTLNGHDYYLGPYGTKASRIEHDRLIAEWLANDRNPLHVTSQDITIVELCLRYWKFAKGYYRKDGRCTGVTPGIKCALQYLKQWYGKTPAAELGPLALKAIRDRMIEDSLSRTYINDHLDRIKRMFKWAVGEQLIPASTYEALRVVGGLRKGRTDARETDPVKLIEDAIVDSTLPHQPSVVADMVRLQRLTWMRPGEVCIIRPCDIDRSGDVWLYRPESHKTQHHGRDRCVPIGSRGQEILLRYLARDAEMHCFRPRDSEEKRRAEVHAKRKTPLSCGNRPGNNHKRKPKRSAGECYSTASYRRAVYRGCDKAFPHPTLGYKLLSKFTDAQKQGLRQWQSDHHWAPNRIRHTAGTEIRREFDLETARTALGHTSTDTTEIYAERDLSKAIEVARQIG